MLEYLVGDSSTIVFAIANDSLRIVEIDVGRRTLESLVDFVRGTMARPAAAASSARAAWRAPLHRLHEYLIAPVERAGVLIGARRLIIVPHAELHYLPFAASSDCGTRRFLIERYDVGYTRRHRCGSASASGRRRGRRACLRWRRDRRRCQDRGRSRCIRRSTVVMRRC